MERVRRTGTRMVLERVGKRIRGDRKLEIALYAALIASALLILAVTGERKKQDASGTPKEAPAVTEQDTEARLKAVLSKIRGAGEVEVMITYENGMELVTAMSTNTHSDTSETSDGERSSTDRRTEETSEPATISTDGGDAPIVLMQKEPTVRGVIVVAEGAADIVVRLNLQRAVQALLNVPPARIEVFERALIRE